MKNSFNIIAALCCLASIANASQGRGGGDICEDRIKIVRDDIKSWIDKGGPTNLNLLNRVSAQDYSARMSKAINDAKIRCVGPNDIGFPVLVNGVPKTCRFDLSNSGADITCDVSKFNLATDSDQYILVHHEYASIAQIEVPNGGDSNYDISNQISDFLENVVVKKLAVKPRSLPSTGNDMFDQIREQFAGGHLPSDKELNIGSEIADCRAYEFLGRLDVWQIDPLRFSKSRGMISFNWGGFLAAQPNGYVGFYAFLMNGVFDRHEFRAANGGNLIIEISVNPEAHFLKPNVIPSIGAPGSGLSAAAYIVCP